MTNHSSKHDHKICGLPHQPPGVVVSSDRAPLRRPNESGYTLVALLAVMTLIAIYALAAAPSMRQQVQREREKETIFRGEQVADAIRAYYIYRNATLGLNGDQALPSSMEQLLEGIPVPGGSKKRQILRPSAARDPLSTNGEWRTIKPRSQALIDFQRSLITYADNLLPTPTDRQMAQLQQFAVPQLTNVLNVDDTDQSTSNDDFDDDSDGPFVGVASRSKNNSFIYYYGIDHHNRWIFTPLFR